MTRRKPNAKPDTASAMSQQRGLVPFQPGQSGNPAGRARGSRNKLGEAFIEALHADFAEHGVATIAKVREEHPEIYVRVIAGLLPKELKIEGLSDLTDEQLDLRIQALLRALYGSGDNEPDDAGAASVAPGSAVH